MLREKSGDDLKVIELQVRELLQSPEVAARCVSEAQEAAAGFIEKGEDVLVMTSRDLITGKDGTESLNIGATVVSDRRVEETHILGGPLTISLSTLQAKALVDFLSGLKPRPRYVIAKVCIGFASTWDRDGAD